MAVLYSVTFYIITIEYNMLMTLGKNRSDFLSAFLYFLGNVAETFKYYAIVY